MFSQVFTSATLGLEQEGAIPTRAKAHVQSSGGGAQLPRTHLHGKSHNYV